MVITGFQAEKVPQIRGRRAESSPKMIRLNRGVMEEEGAVSGKCFCSAQIQRNQEFYHNKNSYWLSTEAEAAGLGSSTSLGSPPVPLPPFLPTCCLIKARSSQKNLKKK